ncbi:MAG: cytochrome c [Planctomycetes bacterium]|nr:cytochrome c [Planctomycetota bacterium]
MRATYGGAMVVAAAGLAFGVTLIPTACRAPASGMSAAAMKTLAAHEGYELFAAHCAACHGARGRGNGPAASALRVRPRDFWGERCRYVSTLNGVPTPEDLMQTIGSGRHFGAMPSSPNLTDREVRILARYVREITRLGWADRLTKRFAGDDETTPEEIEEIALERVTPGDVVTARWHGPEFQADLEAGRTLYLENCASCHGPWGRGDGLDMPLDERGKPIKVRDLTSGKFRGGTCRDEIFKRIRCGIPGTPMSAAAVSDEEIWQLVHYVQFLAGRKRS